MNKTLIIAATILTLGAGSAFASDGNANGWAPPAQVSDAQTTSQAAGQHRLFATGGHNQTSVYGLFSHPGYPQGGEQ